MAPMGRRGRRSKRPEKPARGEEVAPQKAVVVNLDGASDSSGDEAPSSPLRPIIIKTPKKKAATVDHTHLTLSPDKMCRGIMSDGSSDSESGLEEPRPATRSSARSSPVPRVPPHPGIDSDNVDDIFAVNYSAHNYQALRGAYKEISINDINEEREQSGSAAPMTVVHSYNLGGSDDDCILDDNPATARDSRTISLASPPSPTLFDMDRHGQREEVKQNLKGRRRTRALNKSLQEERFKRQRMSLNESLDLSSDVILSEEEEDVNPEIRIRIKWGSESFRLPIRKMQKFSHFYEVLGKKYGVDANLIVLNLKDKIINPVYSPEDLGVTIADVIEGGIGSLQSSSRGQASATKTVTQDPDTISLRIQSCNKRDSINISIGLKEKMNVLMHKYAEEMCEKIDKLRFMFDGEKLNPQSTPTSLALEDGECIDVYKLS